MIYYRILSDKADTKSQLTVHIGGLSLRAFTVPELQARWKTLQEEILTHIAFPTSLYVYFSGCFFKSV